MFLDSIAISSPTFAIVKSGSSFRVLISCRARQRARTWNCRWFTAHSACHTLSFAKKLIASLHQWDLPGAKIIPRASSLVGSNSAWQ